MLCSLHTHSLLCDGQSTLEQMAEAATAQGLSALGFSGHAPAPYDHAAMRDPEAYLREIARLKHAFSGRIALYAGMEIDALCPFDRSRLDYCIGSVHYIRDNRGIIHCIESTPERFERAVRALGSARAVVERYCDTVEQHLYDFRPDIAGHLDIIAKLNTAGRFFDTDSSWYRRAEQRLAHAAAAGGCAVEVNTAGLRLPSRRAVYPSVRILTLLRQNKVPVVITSDAHRACDLTAGFEQARALLRDLGFCCALTMDGGKLKPCAL